MLSFVYSCLQICSYLKLNDILFAFNTLNQRFNCAISNYTWSINFNRISIKEFYFFCHQLIPLIGKNIRKLIFKNTKPFTSQIYLFDKLIPNLINLTLLDYQENEFDLFLPVLHQLKYLTELIIQFSEWVNIEVVESYCPLILYHKNQLKKVELLFGKVLSFMTSNPITTFLYLYQSPNGGMLGSVSDISSDVALVCLSFDLLFCGIYVWFSPLSTMCHLRCI